MMNGEYGRLTGENRMEREEGNPLEGGENHMTD